MNFLRWLIQLFCHKKARFYAVRNSIDLNPPYEPAIIGQPFGFQKHLVKENIQIDEIFPVLEAGKLYEVKVGIGFNGHEDWIGVRLFDLYTNNKINNQSEALCGEHGESAEGYCGIMIRPTQNIKLSVTAERGDSQANLPQLMAHVSFMSIIEL